MKRSNHLHSFLLVAGSSLLAISSAHAATRTWGGGNLNWTDTSASGWNGTAPVWTDTVNINAGTVTLSTDALNVPTGTNTTAVNLGGGTLEISTGRLFYTNWTSTRATVTLSSTSTLRVNSWAYNAAGSLGTLDHNRDRLVVNGGVIEYLGNGTDTGGGRNFTVGTGGATLKASGTGTWTLALDGTTNPTDQIAFNRLRVNSGLTLTLDGASNGQINKIIENSTGTGNITKSGAGTWTLTGTNTYTGVTTISNGSLSVGTIGNGGVAGNLGQASNAATNIVFDGGTLQYTGGNSTSNRAFTINAGKTATIETANNISFAGATGAATTGALTKTGAGKLTLDGVNTYTGTTTISQGTLALGASGSIASSSTVIVGASTTFDVSAVTGGYNLGGTQTLSGSGTVTGAMTVSGTLSPGNSPGFQATGSQTWVDGGDYNFQMLDATGAAGTGFDQIQITGTLDLASLTTGGFAINLWSLSSTGPDVDGNAQNFNNAINQSWTILTTSGGISGFQASDFAINVGANNGTGGFLNPLGGGSFSIDATSNNLVLNFTAVPEPGAALLGGLGMLMLLRRRRTKIG